MATIITRAGKGSPLTNAEVDANFTNLNSDKLETGGGTLTGPTVVNVNSTSTALRITQVGTGAALLVEDEVNPDSTPLIVNASGNVGIGTNSPGVRLDVVGAAAITDNSSSDALRITQTGAGTAQVDGDQGLGILVSHRANRVAIALPRPRSRRRTRTPAPREREGRRTDRCASRTRWSSPSPLWRSRSFSSSRRASNAAMKASTHARAAASLLG